MPTLTTDDLRLIEYVVESTALMEKMQASLDELTEQICTKVINNGTLAELKELIQMLPRGFHRTELQVFLDKAKQGGWDK